MRLNRSMLDNNRTVDNDVHCFFSFKEQGKVNT